MAKDSLLLFAPCTCRFSFAAVSCCALQVFRVAVFIAAAVFVEVGAAPASAAFASLRQPQTWCRLSSRSGAADDNAGDGNRQISVVLILLILPVDRRASAEALSACKQRTGREMDAMLALD